MRTYLVLALALAGCAAPLQTPTPDLVGDKDGVPLYSIRGYTDAGDTSRTNAEHNANYYAGEMCVGGQAHVTALSTAPTNGGIQDKWMATFTCPKLR